MFTSGLYIFPLLPKAQGRPTPMQSHSQRTEKYNSPKRVPAGSVLGMGCQVTGQALMRANSLVQEEDRSHPGPRQGKW